MKRPSKILSFLILPILLISVLSSGMTASAANYKWAGAWGTPAIESGVLVGNDSVFEQNGIHLRDYIPANSTVRTIIRPTIGGAKIRLKFSNAFGTRAITINEVTVAKTGVTDDVVIEDTITQVTFNGGKTSVNIAVGSEIYSDEITFSVSALEKISVSAYFKNTTPMYTVGLYGGTSYLCSALGNRTHKEGMTAVATRLEFTSNSITYYTIPFLTRIDVYAENAYCVVLLGDSTLTNDSYLLLAQKLNTAGIKNVGVIMSGIIGNRLLYDGAGVLGKVYGQSLLKRAQRDAFSVAGVKYVIVKIGDNDVLHPMEYSLTGIAPYASTSDVVNGYRELSNQVKDKGIKLYMCTRTPYKGYEKNFLGSKDLDWSQKGENMLLEINSWILHSSGDYYNGVINLDAMRDPNDTTKLRSQMTTDGIHFSRYGQIAFVDLIPEAAYGVNQNLTDISAILNINPYVAPPVQQSNNNGGGSNGGNNSAGNSNNGSGGNNGNNGSSSSGSQNQSPNVIEPATSGQGVIVPAVTNPSTTSAPNAEMPTIQNANQILVDDDSLNGTPAGAVSDDNASGAGIRQMIGFVILAFVAAAIIAVSAAFLFKINPVKAFPVSRGSYGRTKQKNRV